MARADSNMEVEQPSLKRKNTDEVDDNKSPNKIPRQDSSNSESFFQFVTPTGQTPRKVKLSKKSDTPTSIGRLTPDLQGLLKFNKVNEIFLLVLKFLGYVGAFVSREALHVYTDDDVAYIKIVCLRREFDIFLFILSINLI